MLRAPLRAMRKNSVTLMTYFLFFVYVYWMLFLFVFLSKFKVNQCWLGITQGMITLHHILTIVTLIFFLFSYLRNPGYLKNENVPFIKMLEDFEAS